MANPETDRGYPVLLRLHGQRCIIVGGGRVAARKTPDLLTAGAHVLIISPAWDARLETLAAEGAIEVRRTAYAVGMLAEWRPRLVFAATDSPLVNQQVVDESHAIGAFVDRVDSSPDNTTSSDFGSMATIRRGPITIAVATGGVSPALTAHLRDRLAAAIGPEYATLAQWLADLRPTIRATIGDQQDRHDLWQAILQSSILDQLRQHDEPTAWATLQALVAKEQNK